MTDAAGRLVKTYSGGMRRRLDLAASLVAEPPVLFVDEPTTGLDPVSRGAVWRAVRGLTRDAGTSVLLTTQYLEEAGQLADELSAHRRRAVPDIVKIGFTPLAWILTGFLVVAGAIGVLGAPRNAGKSLEEIQPTVNRMSTLNSSNSTFSGSAPAPRTVHRLTAGTRGRNPRDRVASTRSPRETPAAA